MAALGEKGSTFGLYTILFCAPVPLLIPGFSNQGFFCFVFSDPQQESYVGRREVCKNVQKDSALVLVGVPAYLEGPFQLLNSLLPNKIVKMQLLDC